jgi:hypothetical protein
LTRQRRAELAAMLADGPAFEATHPQLADYLLTTARMPRPADARLRQAEDDFELRLLHYLTGGASENPYWDIVAPAVSRSEDHVREVNGGSGTPSSRLRYAQGLLQAAYAYAIPSPETVDWMVRTVGERPVVEIGAGRGYWAAQLARSGVTVHAYDSEPPGGRVPNTWFPLSSRSDALFHPVGSLRDLATADRGSRHRPAEHALLLCWPPAWDHPMSLRALTAYERRGGNRLIYVGETDPNRSATPEFFEALNARWTLADLDPSHVVWQGLHDVAQSWTRAS